MNRKTVDRLYDFITAYTLARGFAPTLQECADALGVSQPTVHYNASRLVESGKLEKPQRNRPRGLVVTEEEGA